MVVFIHMNILLVTEIQLVVSGKEDGTTPEVSISDLSQQPSVTAEVSAVPKPPGMCCCVCYF